MCADYTDKIERVDAFESKFGVEFQGLYASLNDENGDGTVRVIVRGEVHAKAKNSKIKESLDIIVAVYDAKGRVVGKGDHYLDEDSFFAFDVFEVDLFDVPFEPARIKLYPKAS